MPASYLLRFDDICPTMNWGIWAEIEKLLLEKNVKPILAVVPDNQDPLLMVDPPVPDFWDRVRAWQSRGWTIALHGYQHKYVNSRKGLMGISPYSEFTGLSAEEQESKLRKGMEIFRREGIAASVFVAPAHSFDRATLKLLPKFGLRIISDGLTRYPFASPEGLFWIPQQLWDFTTKRRGVWTICIHHNIWQNGDMEEFVRWLNGNQKEMTCVEDVEKRFAGHHATFDDRLHAFARFVWYFVIRRTCGNLWRSLRGVKRRE